MSFGKSGIVKPRTPDQDVPHPRRKIAQGDTFAWLFAALQLLTPVLAIFIMVVLFACMLLYFLFLR